MVFLFSPFTLFPIRTNKDSRSKGQNNLFEPERRVIVLSESEFREY